MLKELKQFCLKNWEWRTEKPEAYGRVTMLKRIAYGFFFFFYYWIREMGINENRREAE